MYMYFIVSTYSSRKMITCAVSFSQIHGSFPLNFFSLGSYSNSSRIYSCRKYTFIYSETKLNVLPTPMQLPQKYFNPSWYKRKSMEADSVNNVGYLNSFHSYFKQSRLNQISIGIRRISLTSLKVTFMRDGCETKLILEKTRPVSSHQKLSIFCVPFFRPQP